MSAPVIIDYLMDALLRQSTIQDNKQAVAQNGSEIRERMGKRRDFEVSSDNVTDENLKMKNLSDGKTSRKRKKRTKRVEEKDTFVDESQSIAPLIMEEGSTNLAEGNATVERNKKRKRKKAKVNDEVQILGQDNMDTGSTAKKVVTIENLRLKDDVRSMGLTRMDERYRENLAEGNVNFEKPKSKDEGRTADKTRMSVRSTVNLSGGNVTLKNNEIQEEVQSIDGCRMEMGSTEKNSDSGICKRKKKHKRKAKIKDEVQGEIDTRSGEMNVRSTENFVEGDVTFEKPKVKDDVKTIGQFKNESGSAENSVVGDVKVEKPRIKDEVQNLDQIAMVSGSTAEGSVTIRVAKTQDQVQSMNQINMDTRPSEHVADGLGTKKKKKKRKSKAKIKDEVQRDMDTRSTEALAEENATVEKPKIGNEILGVGQTKLDTGSSKNLTEGNLTIKDKKVQEEVESMDQTKIDTGRLTENSTEGNETGKRKKKRRSKVQIDNEVQSNIDTTEKPKIEDEVQSGVRTTLDTVSSVNPDEGNVTLKNSNIQDEAHSMHQTKMDMGPTEEFAEGNVTAKSKKQRKKKAMTEDVIPSEMDTRLTENLAERNASIKKPETDNEVRSMGLTKMDTGSKENLAEGHVTIENPKITEVRNVEKTKVGEGPIGDFTEGNVSGGRKRKRKSRRKKAKSEEEFLSACQGGSTSLNCELHIDGKLGGDCINSCGTLPRSMELESKLFPSESLRICHPQHLDVQKEKSENDLSEVCNEIILDKGKDYADGTSAVSTCDVRETTKDVCSQTAPSTSIRRKLLVLDVNGLLADIVYQGANESSGGVRMYGRTVYKRPFCDDFLKFCFQNFDVGIWSSRSKKIIGKVVSYLLGDQRDKLLFCWDMDHSTQTGLKTLENKHKPLVCKELRKIWENAYPNLPWKKGDYDESNTLLLDDSPYKALLNPLHTAIFPDPYQYGNEKDDSLGPGGALRVYLEGLLTSEDVQKYVEQHPIGQRPITEESSSWKFYSSVLHKKTSVPNPLKDKKPMSSPPLTDETPLPNPQLTDETPLPNHH